MRIPFGVPSGGPTMSWNMFIIKFFESTSPLHKFEATSRDRSIEVPLKLSSLTLCVKRVHEVIHVETFARHILDPLRDISQGCKVVPEGKSSYSWRRGNTEKMDTPLNYDNFGHLFIRPPKIA